MQEDSALKRGPQSVPRCCALRAMSDLTLFSHAVPSAPCRLRLPMHPFGQAGRAPTRNTSRGLCTLTPSCPQEQRQQAIDFTADCMHAHKHTSKVYSRLHPPGTPACVAPLTLSRGSSGRHFHRNGIVHTHTHTWNSSMRGPSASSPSAGGGGCTGSFSDTS